MKNLLVNVQKSNRIFDSRRGRYCRCAVGRILGPAGEIQISEEKDAAGGVRYPRHSLACVAGTQEIVYDGVANAQVYALKNGGTRIQEPWLQRT